MTLCKFADAAAAETLVWQQFGAPVVSGQVSMTAVTPTLRPLNSSNGANADQHEESLKRRVAELERNQHAELEQARRSGFEQGFKQARQEAGAEMESALDRLARTIQETAQVKRKIRAEAEHELVKLSLAIAHRILHREISTDPQSLLGVVHAALQRLQNREITKIRVFPAAVSAVRAALERNGGMAAIEILPDSTLAPGGVIFETSLGELDASVDTQLQEIERGFTDRLQLRP